MHQEGPLIKTCSPLFRCFRPVRVEMGGIVGNKMGAGEHFQVFCLVLFDQVRCKCVMPPKAKGKLMFSLQYSLLNKLQNTLDAH